MPPEPPPTTDTTLFQGAYDEPDTGKAQPDPTKNGPDYGPDTGTDEVGAALSGFKSAWANDFNNRRHIISTYYTDPSSGAVSPLQERLHVWRSDYAQTGDADLSDLLDFNMSYMSQPRQGGTGWTKTAKQWRTKQQNKTVAWWLEHLRTGDEKTVGTWQQRLHEAGFMPIEVYKNPGLLMEGYYDNPTQEAFTALLKETAMLGDVPMSEVLRRRKQQIDKAGGIAAWLKLTGIDDEPEIPAFQAQVTNPADVLTAGRDISQELTGRMTPGENVSAAGLQGQEIASQRQMYDLQVANKSGTVVEPPSIGSYTEEAIRAANAPEVDAYSYLQNVNHLLARVGLG